MQAPAVYLVPAGCRSLIDRSYMEKHHMAIENRFLGLWGGYHAERMDQARKACETLASGAKNPRHTGFPVLMPKNTTNSKIKDNNMSELQDTIYKIGEEFTKFRDRNDKKVEALSAQIDALDKAMGRQSLPGGMGSSRATSTTENEHKQKFLDWARKGADPDGLKNIEASLSTLSSPDGGYLVPIEIEKSIERLSLSSVAMRRLARIKTSQGDYTKPLSKGGATGGWVSEKESRTETDTPELTLFSPPWCELYAMPVVTQKLLDLSSFDIEGWLAEEISEVFTSKEGQAFILGSGASGVPHGLIDESLMVADSSWTYGKTGYIVGGHATLLNSADALINLQHSLKPVYRQNGTFLMSDSTLSVIRRLKDGNGDFLYCPGLQESSPDFLLGRPVEIDENMPDIGAGSYPIAFGDFQRAYTIVDHTSGVRCMRDPYSQKGSVAYYTVKRVAAGISNHQAVKFLKISE